MTEIPEHLLRRARERREGLEHELAPSVSDHAAAIDPPQPPVQAPRKVQTRLQAGTEAIQACLLDNTRHYTAEELAAAVLSAADNADIHNEFERYRASKASRRRQRKTIQVIIGLGILLLTFVVFFIAATV